MWKSNITKKKKKYDWNIGVFDRFFPYKNIESSKFDLFDIFDSPRAQRISNDRRIK